jgi:hypothetical protein
MLLQGPALSKAVLETREMKRNWGMTRLSGWGLKGTPSKQSVLGTGHEGPTELWKHLPPPLQYLL